MLLRFELLQSRVVGGKRKEDSKTINKDWCRDIKGKASGNYYKEFPCENKIS